MLTLASGQAVAEVRKVGGEDFKFGGELHAARQSLGMGLGTERSWAGWRKVRVVAWGGGGDWLGGFGYAGEGDVFRLALSIACAGWSAHLW